MKLKIRAIVTACAAMAAAAGMARGQCTGQQIVSGDPQVNAYNGTSVALDGAYVLSSATGQNVSGHAGAGEVYAYAPFGAVYGQVAHITAPTPGNGDAFGYAVGLGGGAQWAVIGAPFTGSAKGQAYIYQRDLNTNLWNLSADLGAGTPGSETGESVAINTQGSIAVVGAPGATISDIFGTTLAEGQALVYVRNGNTWTYQFDLHQYDPSLRHENDDYALSVACDGGTVLTGSPVGGDAAHSGCGYVHFWSQGLNAQWSADGEVYAPDAAPGSYFGQAVAINGGYAVVGAPGATFMGDASAGCVYVYRLVNGAWVYDSTLHASDPAAGDQFGSTLSIHGNHLAVGTTTLTAQKVYAFRRTAAGVWVQDAVYRNPGASGDRFCSEVSIGNTQFIVGAWAYGTPSYSHNGCAYVYNLPTAGSDSCEGATLVGQGSVSGCTNNCTVDGSSTCGGNVPGPDVWYRYTAPSSGQLTIDTIGSTLDTVLSVHSGCPGDGNNTIACNDDYASPQRWSQVTFPVVRLHEYLIRISGYGGGVGEYTLNVGPVVAGCYANCDGSTTAPVLNVNDFICFQARFAAGDSWANCDGSTTAPVLNINDFICYQGRFAAGCP